MNRGFNHGRDGIRALGLYSTSQSIVNDVRWPPGVTDEGDLAEVALAGV
jgi:hypothetical protein